jgi:hypothetical protein
MTSLRLIDIDFTRRPRGSKYRSIVEGSSDNALVKQLVQENGKFEGRNLVSEAIKNLAACGCTTLLDVVLDSGKVFRKVGTTDTSKETRG